VKQGKNLIASNRWKYYQVYSEFFRQAPKCSSL